MGWGNAAALLALAVAGCGRVGFERTESREDAGLEDAARLDDAGLDAGGIGDAGDAGAPPCDYAALVLSLGPRAYWRLGDPGATAVDATGNGYDGTYIGGTHGAGALATDADRALELDGARHYVDIVPRDLVSSVSAITLMAWTRTTTIPQGGTPFLPNFVPVVVIRGTDPMLARAIMALVERNEIWTLGRTDDTATMPQQLVTNSDVYPLDGAWHFVVTETDFAGGRFRTWIDGAPGPSAAAAFTFMQTQPEDGSNGAIGGSVPYDSWFDGAIDEVAVFTRTLDDADIAAIYACAR